MWSHFEQYISQLAKEGHQGIKALIAAERVTANISSFVRVWNPSFTFCFGAQYLQYCCCYFFFITLFFSNFFAQSKSSQNVQSFFLTVCHFLLHINKLNTHAAIMLALVWLASDYVPGQHFKSVGLAPNRGIAKKLPNFSLLKKETEKKEIKKKRRKRAEILWYVMTCVCPSVWLCGQVSFFFSRNVVCNATKN